LKGSLHPEDVVALRVNDPMRILPSEWLMRITAMVVTSVCTKECISRANGKAALFANPLPWRRFPPPCPAPWRDGRI
jgi:hypothetical protein